MQEADEKENTTAAELDELRRENEELKTAARLREAREAMTAELARAGARSPGLLFGAASAEIEFDDEGRAVNVAALVARLKGEYPEQFAAAHTAGPIDAGSGTRPAPPLTADALARMTPDEIKRLDWADVRSALSDEGR